MLRFTTHVDLGGFRFTHLNKKLSDISEMFFLADV